MRVPIFLALRALFIGIALGMAPGMAATPDAPFLALALGKEPTALLQFRTTNRVEKVSSDKIPRTLAAPFWLLSRDEAQVSYQTQLHVWTPQTAPEDASGGLQNLAGAAPQEWALQITPAPAWPDLPSEPKTEAQIAVPVKDEAVNEEEIKADDPQNAPEITVPETLRAEVYSGCGDAAEQGQPRLIRIATAVLDRWHHLGRLPIDWSGIGSLGQAQNTQTAAELSAAKTNPRSPGEYRLITSFVPDLNFTVGTEQQFMPPLRLSLGPLPLNWSQPLQLNWSPVEGARGYRVRAIGQRFRASAPNSAIVLWSSTPLARLQSEVPIVDVESALKKGEILPSDTLNCTIPAAIFKDVGEITFVLEAIGQTRTFPASKAPQNAPSSTFGGITLRVATISEAVVTLETGQAVN